MHLHILKFIIHISKYKDDGTFILVNSVLIYFIIIIILFVTPEFSESMDHRGIHQLAATCKTNKKTTVVFCRPSNGKVSFFGKLRVRTAVISIKNVVPDLV